MDPNIITIDSDDSNDTSLLQSKNNQTSLVIVHRVINTNSSNNQNNSNNLNLDIVNDCSVNQQVLQNNKHFNLNVTKDHEIIAHINETKKKSNSNILESEISQCIEIIDVENYKNKHLQTSKSNNKVPIANSLKNNRNTLMLKNETFNNKEVINLCSEKEQPIRPAATFLSNSEILQLQVSENRNMNPPPKYEHSIAWAHNTTNLMKQSMNSVMQSNKLVLLQNPPTAHQSSSIPHHHLSNNQEFLQKNMYKTTEIRNVQSMYHSPVYSCMNNTNYFQPGYYNNGIMMNSYVPNNNFWMRVKVEEIPEGGEVVAQYFYNNETQTPVTIENHFQGNAIASDSNSQFIDISCLPPDMMTSLKANDNKLDAKNNNSEDDCNKDSKICVPPLLKRAPVPSRQNVHMISCENYNTTNTNNYDNVGDKDVIFVGEFKQNSNILVDSTKKCNQGTTELNRTKTKNSINLNMNNDDTKQVKKRLRKSYDTIELRRNPKRQVQVNKEFNKLIDDILWNDVEKENKIKKTGPKANKERMDKKPIRVSPRVHTTCGAVYSPPSPLSADHIRKWPTEGMHERPEYNPQTGEIEPFDYVTRNIANSYNSKISTESKCTTIMLENANKTSNKCNSINVLSHEMLHHMISYVATVMQVNKCTTTTTTPTEATNELNKVDFLNDLGLVENDNLLLTEKNCDNLKQVFKNIIGAHAKDGGGGGVGDKANEKHNLKELLKNTMLMYCITNDVSQSDLVKYIDSLKAEDIISTSNEQFGIS